MKTTKSKKIEASAPANVRPSKSVSKTSQPDRQAELKKQEFQRHCANRGLSTDTVLNYLRERFPRQYEVAEVVGRWIWLDADAEIDARMRIGLWLLGFHLNRYRGVWQHPCGAFDPFCAHTKDPRAKYRCYFPADVLAA